jgi:8-oxo-dGTP pyrophosphatase MutT (NUDIX family)
MLSTACFAHRGLKAFCCFLRNMNRIQYCTNCGLAGHLFRNCLSPVTSYGVIAVRYQDDTSQSSLFSTTVSNGNDSIEFLMIQRKDSMSFVEFIRGKYNLQDDTYISRLMRGMTQNEHQLLLTMTFPQLWFKVWGGETSCTRSHKNDYESSERRYGLIVERIPTLVRENPTKWTEPEWGFPKGRRSPYESDIGCAIREFQEESGLTGVDFTVLQNTNSISETFFGSNQVHYCHKYYIAICHKTTEVEMKMDNFHMAREVGAIMWCSLDEATSKIRPDNVEKREILLKAGKIMKNFYPISTSEMARPYRF